LGGGGVFEGVCFLGMACFVFLRPLEMCG